MLPHAVVRTKGRVLHLVKRLSLSKARYKTSCARKMDESRPFEEEKVYWYKPDQWYPVRLGEVLDDRYRVVGKLGYGTHSTVWLCRKTKEPGFVSVKVCTRTQNPPSSRGENRELAFYKHIISLNSEHPGQAYIRNLFGTFELDGPAGKHTCFVQPPMHMNLYDLLDKNPERRLTKQILNWVLHNLLHALSFLHDSKVVHTDINGSNIMFTIEDESLLTEFEQEEIEDPLPRKVIDETRTIYGSRLFGLPKGSAWGRPVLCDFGETRIGPTHRGKIHPELYRAPEVLFDMEWNWSADIWTVAHLIWTLFEDRHLFSSRDKNGDILETEIVAEMIGYLGVPPLEYLRRSEVTKNVFDDQGHWKSLDGVAVPEVSLEEREIALEGEDQKKFLNFVRSMLKWVPEERPTADQLLADPWILDAVAAMKADPGADTKADPKADTKAEPESDTKVDPKADKKADPEAKPDGDLETKLDADTQADPNAHPEAHPKAKPDAGPEVDPEANTTST